MKYQYKFFANFNTIQDINIKFQYNIFVDFSQISIQYRISIKKTNTIYKFQLKKQFNLKFQYKNRYDVNIRTFY